jgi:hypothetical protein
VTLLLNWLEGHLAKQKGSVVPLWSYPSEWRQLKMMSCSQESQKTDSAPTDWEQIGSEPTDLG